MPRMRVERKQCAECRYFEIEGISYRCTLPDNTYKNWLGMMYIKNPIEKNMRGNCPDYTKDRILETEESGKG